MISLGILQVQPGHPAACCRQRREHQTRPGILPRECEPLARGNVTTKDSCLARVNLESILEYVPRPRRRLLFPTTKPAKMRSFYTGADIQAAPIPVSDGIPAITRLS
jgi:hypothetical protein